MTPDAILFDAGNTLVYADPERLAAIFRAEGVPADANVVAAAELEARRGLHDAIHSGHVGTEPEVWREYFVSLFRLGGVPLDRMVAVGEHVREVHREDHLWTRVAPGTGEALSGLLEAGFRLGVISNADGRMAALLGRCGLLDFFEFVVDSEDVGVEKPDARIFLEGCGRMDLEPDRCLYVGDLYPVDYLGATEAGMQAVLLDPLGLHAHHAATISALDELAGHLASGPSGG